RLPAGQVSQVRTDRPTGRRGAGADAVAANTALARKDLRAALHEGVVRLRRRPALGVEPGLEGGRVVGDDVERHVRVLDAAELGALPAVDAGPVGLEPEGVLLAGDEVHLALQLGHP